MERTMCREVLVEHRVMTLQELGARPNTKRMTIYECPDPSCTADPHTHATSLPCRWSWRLARGKKSNGSSFPVKRCPGCRHIRRAGAPAGEEMSG